MNPSSEGTIETKELTKNDQQLGFLILLKTTLKKLITNIHCLSFFLYTSFPLLLMKIVFEMLLERTLNESLKFLKASLIPSFNFRKASWSWRWLSRILLYREEYVLTQDFYRRSLFLVFIYLVPLHLLQFFTGFITVNMASKVYEDDQDSSSSSSRSIRDIVLRELINKGRLKDSFVTSIYVLFCSTCFLLGFIYLLTVYYNFCEYPFLVLTVAPVHIVVAIMLFPKYLELSTVWNLGLVFSILEEVQGATALNESFYFSNGNRGLGRNLMLVFHVLGIFLRIPCLFFDDGYIGIIGRTSLLWLGDLARWVVLVVYYYYCKRKVSGMKNDEDAGKKNQFYK